MQKAIWQVEEWPLKKHPLQILADCDYLNEVYRNEDFIDIIKFMEPDMEII